MYSNMDLTGHSHGFDWSVSQGFEEFYRVFLKQGFLRAAARLLLSSVFWKIGSDLIQTAKFKKLSLDKLC